MSWPKDIVLVGAGNLAWHLGRRLLACGQRIVHIHRRSATETTDLAQLANCMVSHRYEDIPTNADLYIIAASDSSITAVCNQLAPFIDAESLVVHTSGATPSSVLEPHFSRYGVFYPLQTFSRQREVNFSEVPLCLCSARVKDYERLYALASSLVQNVYAVSDEQRLHLHLAAVFVNNFTNYLQHIAQGITQENNLSSQLLHPLLQETIAKLANLPASAAQTGPAIRGDQATIERHLALLERHPQWQEVYQVLTKGIAEERL